MVNVTQNQFILFFKKKLWTMQIINNATKHAFTRKTKTKTKTTHQSVTIYIFWNNIVWTHFPVTIICFSLCNDNTVS